MFPQGSVKYSSYAYLYLNSMLASPVFIIMLNKDIISLFSWKHLNVILVVFYNRSAWILIISNLPTGQRIGMMHKPGASSDQGECC